jgi:hypothetical protein
VVFTGMGFFFSLLVCILFLVLYLYVFHLYLEDREGEVIFSRSALFSSFSLDSSSCFPISTQKVFPTSWQLEEGPVVGYNKA